MTDKKRSVRLAGKAIEHSPHICAFFGTQEEEYQVLLPFIKQGLEEGEKAFHIIDPGNRPSHLERLRQAGIDTEDSQTRGQLEVRDWAGAYLRENRFDQNRMLELIEQVLTEGRENGFPITRLVAHMEWSLLDYPGVRDLVEYESRLNYLLPKYEDPVICTYDLSKFSAETVMDVLRVHPLVIIGGILHENPFYTQPDDFLQELHQRTGTAN